MQCHVYGKKCTQPTNVGGVSARRRSGAPPRRGCVANSRMTKSCNKLVRSPPALLCCFPPPVDGQASVSSPRPSINVPRAQEATQLISPPPPFPLCLALFIHHYTTHGSMQMTTAEWSTGTATKRRACCKGCGEPGEPPEKQKRRSRGELQ